LDAEVRGYRFGLANAQIFASTAFHFAGTRHNSLRLVTPLFAVVAIEGASWWRTFQVTERAKAPHVIENIVLRPMAIHEPPILATR
jgi:hypothetical protein